MQRELHGTELMAEMWRGVAHRLHAEAATPAPTHTLEPILRKLLTLAHPDCWSQGQDAAQLAHKLAVTINSLRAEVQ